MAVLPEAISCRAVIRSILTLPHLRVGFNQALVSVTPAMHLPGKSPFAFFLVSFSRLALGQKT